MTNKVLNNINDFRKKYEPEILMSMGIGGLIFSLSWGIKATIKAVNICEKKKKDENKEKLTAKEIFLATWKLYLPVVLGVGVSVPCLIASNKVSSKRNAAIAAAYTISETALQEYQKKTKEVIGEEKEKEIKELIAKEKVEKGESPGKEIILYSDDEQLFYEPITGRYFKSNWNTIQKAANEINEEALGSSTGSYSLNDWFEKIGLPFVVAGNILGWSTPSYMNSQGLMKISMTTSKTKDDKPCGAIYYNVMPYNVQ